MVKQKKTGFFKSKEDMISMFLGLVVVVAVVGFIVNFIEKRKGNIDIPGISNNSKVEEEIKIGKEGDLDNVVVQSNDSLWKIATRVYGDGYKWVEIAKENNLKNPGLIYSGQKLSLPKISKIETNSNIDKGSVVLGEKTDYKVVRGDSLWKIAVRVYGDGNSWTKIWRDNKSKLNSPDKLEIGMVLSIYGKI